MTPFKNIKDVEKRFDYQKILEIVSEGERVLDLGCGNGELLYLLREKKNCFVKGIEIAEDKIISCLQKGIPVEQKDIEAGLGNFKDNTFDYVILSQTLQVIRNTSLLINEMLRVGRVGIVSFPNFGYWKIRLYLLLKGAMPKTRAIPYNWYDTPNVHLFTIKDFNSYCRQHKIRILQEIDFNVDDNGTAQIVRYHPNLFAQYSIFVITRHPS